MEMYDSIFKRVEAAFKAKGMTYPILTRDVRKVK